MLDVPVCQRLDLLDDIDHRVRRNTCISGGLLRNVPENTDERESERVEVRVPASPCALSTKPLPPANGAHACEAVAMKRGAGQDVEWSREHESQVSWLLRGLAQWPTLKNPAVDRNARILRP